MSRAGGTSSERRFVWPPKRADAQSPAGNASAVAAATTAQPAPQGPAAAPRESVQPVKPAVATPPRTSWRSGLLEIERIWLGLETPPLSDRIAAAGWAPDSLDAYCHRCGLTVGPYEAGLEGCPACRSRRLGWERMVRLGEYTGLLRDVIQEVKFSRWRRLGDEIGAMLGRSLAEMLTRERVDPAAVAIVPVPSSFRRRMARGIDHCLVISRGVSRETGIPIVRGLSRSHRPSQLSVPASRRGANVAGSIRARPGVGCGAQLVVVLDDVTTSRATLMAATRAVAGAGKGQTGQELDGSKAGVRVWAAVVAVTPQSGRRARSDQAEGGAESPHGVV